MIRICSLGCWGHQECIRRTQLSCQNSFWWQQLTRAHTALVPVPSWRESPCLQSRSPALPEPRARGHPATSLVTFVCLPWPFSSTSPGTSLCRQHHGAWGHRLWHGTESVGTADPCATKSCHVAGGVALEMEEVATARISSCHSSCFSVVAASGEQNPPSHSAGSWAPRG